MTALLNWVTAVVDFLVDLIVFLVHAFLIGTAVVFWVERGRRS